MEASAWAFGWEALVAIGTFSLATVTYLLARATQRLAATTALEVQSQYRPIVIPVETAFTVDVDADANRLGLGLRNIGAGPALDLKFSWGAPMGPDDPRRADYYPDFPRQPSRPVLAHGSEMRQELLLPKGDPWGKPDNPITQIRLEYRDMAGRVYRTVFGWENWKLTLPNPPRLNSVELSDGSARLDDR
jgi:hypothetical protein